jgi:signal transduction histidine kinase
VLVLYSFGRDYFDEIAGELRTELARASGGPVELFEVSLETARLAGDTSESAILGYLHALFDEKRLDILIAVAGPAARFCVNHRDALFPTVPLVLAGVESRVMTGMRPAGRATSIPIALDFTVAVENILRVAPETTEVAVVLGRSAISRLWLAEMQRELSPLSRRVRFTWFQDLSLEEMRERVARLPRNAAVLFGEYGGDAGLADEADRALDSLHRVSSAPVFGLFESQLGHGIVGGPLLSEREVGRRAGAVARGILEGESHDGNPPGVVAGSPVYDFRELARWGIARSRLPPGSTVLYEPSSLWKEHGGTIAIGIGLLVLQTALLGGLFLQRTRRRFAEEESRALARRLLTAHEDERRRLARELHDDLSQRLARLSIDAARVERSIPASSEKEAARTMRADLARLGDDVHSLAYQLHPSVLDDLGLNDALKVECEQFSRRESIPARLTSFEAPSDLPSDVAVCLFRIAQEALRNAARHSRSKEVSLAVTTRNGGVRMTVRDDGVGFDSARTGFRRSLGQASMRERARLLGGTLEIESAPGRGTTVNVSLPLKEGSP